MKLRTLITIASLQTLLCIAVADASLRAAAPRQTITLDGTWQIAEGAMDVAPAHFDHAIPVPGLVDMAQPAFAEVGRKSALRQAFWYRRTFKLDGPLPPRAVLKINKAMYGMRVLLNGQPVGEHLPCFTPAYFDVKSQLRVNGAQNELVIRIGADRESLPPGVPSGADPEKLLYIPGIYDSVELILTGTPYIASVQTVPQLADKRVRVVVEIESDGGVPVTADVTEARSGKPAGSAKAAATRAPDGKMTADFTVALQDAHLWSPEDPFLYALTLRTPGDAVTVRFGMRSFSFDPMTRRAMLNGQPYFMRGTNVTLLRFFEDRQRGDRPWRAEWVRRLHQKFKSMNWNSIRYCIGLAPESWYDIADEEGFLIQDEFPIWIGVRPPLREALPSEQLIPQFTAWMRERWNHPCVVIWDAQNESVTEETGKTIAAVRGLDLSDRPWDNGWSPPQSPTKDSTEAHPYLFNRTFRSKGENPFRLSQIPTVNPKPALRPGQAAYGAAIIVNEYDWLWLTRDGEPTTLTQHVYASLLPSGATVEQRREVHARNVAALTEFWRAGRACAAVLHFCGLGYSRPGDQPVPQGGATSDDFVDIERLVFEPRFERYVRDAFNPVGVTIDFWEDHAAAGETRTITVRVSNDLPQDWSGKVRLEWRRGEAVVEQQSQPCKVAATGTAALQFKQILPLAPGDYIMAAVLVSTDGSEVKSLRDISLDPHARPVRSP